MLFQRLSIAAERKLTLDGSLIYELTIQLASLFYNEHFMRDSHTNKLGKFQKEKLHYEDSYSISSLVVDGGWLIHQVLLVDGRACSLCLL